MEKDQPPQSSQDAKSDAELRKLNLEIEVLKGHNPWIETFVKLVPVVTTLVALLGLFFTVLQAINVQSEERINKIQSQIRADKEQILDFITNDKISSVRVAFLIDDLDSLIKELSDDEGEANAITEHLMRVAWELPFDRRRDFDFDVSALKRWAHYRRFWQSYPDSHHMFLVKKYYPRLSLLHSRHLVLKRRITRLEFSATRTPVSPARRHSLTRS